MKKSLTLKILFTFSFLLSSTLGSNQTLSSQNDPSKSFYFESMEERERIEKYLRNILFWEGGIFTLLGNKPITIIRVAEEIDTSDEPFNPPPEGVNFMMLLNADDEQDLKFYSSLSDAIKTHAFLLPEKDCIYNAYSLWEVWSNWELRPEISSKYIMVEKDLLEEEVESMPDKAKGHHLILVNVAETVLILEKHYSLFQEALGCDFDPLEETLRTQEEDSLIWRKILARPYKNHLASGLLLGFGWENSLAFHLKYSKESNGLIEDQGALGEMECSVSEDVKQIYIQSDPMSATNFPLPAFMSFNSPDPVVEEYRKQRDDIIGFYTGKDFVDATIDILSDDSQSQSQNAQERFSSSK